MPYWTAPTRHPQEATHGSRALLWVACIKTPMDAILVSRQQLGCITRHPRSEDGWSSTRPVPGARDQCLNDQKGQQKRKIKASFTEWCFGLVGTIQIMKNRQ